MPVCECVFQAGGSTECRCVGFRQGEYWKTSRRTLNPRLMKPQAAGEYIAGMNSTTEEFVARLRLLKAAQPDGRSVQQLPLEINKYTMEGEASPPARRSPLASQPGQGGVVVGR